MSGIFHDGHWYGNTGMVCRRCGNPVYQWEHVEYSYQCFHCDEDLYSFADGERHLLKALEMQKNGGCVMCILNAETLKNPYTKERKLLVRKLEELGAAVEYYQSALQSEEYPFMFADLDGVINENGEMAVFEAKTASAYKQEVWEEGVPAPYILQVHHYMAVTGAKRTYIAALVGGNHFFYHVVERDDEMMAKMIAMEKYFWETHVLGGVEPVPDGSDATTDYFNSRFSHSNGMTIELPEEALSVCVEYDRLSEELKKVEAAKNAAANQLKSYLKEAEAGTVGDRMVTWKEISKSTVDTKRLRTEKPEIYNSFLKDSSYRRLSVA